MRLVLIAAIALAVLTVSQPARAQNDGRAGQLLSDTEVRLLPDPARVPLATLKAGTAVRVLDTEGDWYRIAFRDNQYGRRVGYVQKAAVDIPELRAAAEAAQKREAARAEALRRAASRPPDRPAAPRPTLTLRDLMTARPAALASEGVSEDQGVTGS